MLLDIRQGKNVLDDRYNFAAKKVLIMGLGRFGGGVDSCTLFRLCEPCTVLFVQGN